ncbi:hypothetical protein HZC35_03465 [Candidatus Saganbacteria bacterium]|nr:hypothetical protein [Candidatus Saganbacteria bacterium]
MDINPIKYGFNLPPLQLELGTEEDQALTPVAGNYSLPILGPLQPAEITPAEEGRDYSLVYLASTQCYGENIMEGGYLPVLEPNFQLLLRYFQVNNSAPPADPSQFYYPERYATTYGGGLQFRWFQPSGGSLYGRLQIADRETADGTHRDSAIEFTYAELAEKFIMRGLVQTFGDETRVSEQLYARFPILENDRLNVRIGIEYANGAGADQAVTILGKLDGTIRPDPWWGWNVQLFVPIPTHEAMIEEYPGPGLFFWTGFVHSDSAFSEIMLYLNTRTLDDVRDVVGGLILKTKFGTEARWWP